MRDDAKRILQKVPIGKINSELQNIKSELNKVLALRTEKQRSEWLKKHPKAAQRIWRAYLNLEIEWSIKTLEELHALFEERLGPEKRQCEAIISRIPIPSVNRSKP